MYDENPFPDGTTLHTVMETLRKRQPAPPILPHQVWDSSITAALNGLKTGGGADTPSDNVLALLHLINDDLDSAHQLVQPRERDATSSYIHCIVHRREGDWSNARYWSSRTGQHPFYEPLLEAARATVQGGMADSLSRWSRWETSRMIDLCEKASTNPGPVADQVAELAAFEMRSLLGWCVTNNA